LKLLISTALFLALSQIDLELWPVGYFDQHGELSYADAAQAIGLLPPKSKQPLTVLLSECGSVKGNIISWKMAMDSAFSSGSKANLLSVYETYVHTQKGSDYKRSGAAFSAYSYAWLAMENHLPISEGRINDNADPWRKFLGHPQGLSENGLPTKHALLARMSSDMRSPSKMRQDANIARKLLNCPYFCDYLVAESYKIGIYPGPGNPNPKIEPDAEKCLSLFQEMIKKYPSEPTPYYKVAGRTADKTARRQLANQYLKLEKRSFKSRWIKNARQWATGS
jgi:hypothetical protein